MDTFDPHKNTTEVRQAGPQKGNYRVLVIALIVVVLAFAVIWGVYAVMPEGNVIS